MKLNKFLFFCSCILFSISCLSILLTVAGDYEGSHSQFFIAVLSASLFWGNLILALACLIILNIRRKKSGKKAFGRHSGSDRIGVICFFSNRAAAVIDVIMILLFIALPVIMFTLKTNGYINLILIVFTVISVYMHSMFNGLNFRYIKSKSIHKK